jgi:hypothetical protein
VQALHLDAGPCCDPKRGSSSSSSGSGSGGGGHHSSPNFQGDAPSCSFRCHAGNVASRASNAARAAGETATSFIQDGGITNPSYGAGVADGLANAAYAPVRATACMNMVGHCSLVATVHIPLDGDTSSSGYKVGHLIGTITSLAVPGSAPARIAVTADRAATAAVTTARVAKATEAGRTASASIRTAAESCANSFTQAIHLRLGHHLLTADHHATTLTATKVHTQNLTAYNLHIADIHTYYRVKPVVPGRGFVKGSGRKQVPTDEHLTWIKALWR